jgi:asparagine synthase (glutamine-hydrolysing)
VSGIAGILYFDGRAVAPASLRTMAASLAHRGPDGSGVWTAGPVGLAHGLFATTPESKSSHQPLGYAAGRLVITADARIDNRLELAGLLGLQGEEAQKPDEYFILKAYDKWGQECAGRLLGDFAFAIWDGSRNQLFCARDTLGVKPFYYHVSSDKFIFASEIKAILSLGVVPRQLNESCLLDYLLDDRQDKEITFFRGISRLPPAHFLSASPQGYRMESYWSLDPAKEIRFENSADYAERFLELFTQSVKARLSSAVPIGSALSGGLDSSSVASVARNILTESGGGPLHTYSAIFSGLSAQEISLLDERQYIEMVLATGGFQPHFVDMASVGPLTSVEEFLRILDEPVSAPTLAMFGELYKAASHQGVGVYLEGIDGDLVVSHGYERFLDLVQRLSWATWLREVRAVSKRSGISQSEIIKRFTLRFLIPPPVYRTMRKLRGRGRGPGDSLDYLNEEFVHQESIKIRIDEFKRRKNTLPHNAKQAHLQELTSGNVPLSLELLDKVAAHCNVDIRYPFYDQRVIEYCLAVPADQKLTDGWSRFIFRNSLAGILPEDIRWRSSKADFRPFFRNGMLRLSGPFLEEVLSDKSAYLEPYVDIAGLRALYKRFTSGAFCSTREVEILYRSAILSKWIELS